MSTSSEPFVNGAPPAGDQAALAADPGVQIIDQVLGCPSRYDAAIQWRGGGADFILAVDIANYIESLDWDRRLEATSQAKMTINLTQASEDCCLLLGRVEPALHELIIYRDGKPVWLGPVTYVEQQGASITIEAQDMSMWLRRLVNTVDCPWQMGTTGPWDICKVAESVIRGNMLNQPLSCPADYANMLNYMLVTPAGINWSSKIRTQWYSRVLDILENLADKGFDWMVVLRSLIIRPSAPEAPVPGWPWSYPQAMLQADDLGGDVSVVRNIDLLATRMFATDQDNQYQGVTQSVGINCTPYGRLDERVFENIDPGDQKTDKEKQILLDRATEEFRGRYPSQAVFKVGDNARLSPTAPITIEQLIPGARVDVIFNDYCRPIYQGFRISYVNCTWDRDGENLRLSLVPLKFTPKPIDN